MQQTTKILVTGGGGFLGTEIIKQARARWPNMEIRSLSRSHYPHLATYAVTQYQADLQDKNSLRQAAESVSAIIHTAAKAGVWGKASAYDQVNVQGTQNVIDICRDLQIPYLIYTSSPSVTFSGQDQEGESETAPYPHLFLNDYSRTKAAAEALVLQANSPTLKTIALRPHLIWGPNDPHLVKRIRDRALAGKLKLIASAKPCLVDSTYISNAAYSHILALEKFLQGDGVGIAGKAYFISNGEPLAINDLICKIALASGAPAPSKFVSRRMALLVGTALEGVYRFLAIDNEPLLTRFVVKQMTTHHWFDLTAAKRDLGYRPLVSIEEGFARLRDRAHVY